MIRSSFIMGLGLSISLSATSAFGEVVPRSGPYDNRVRIAQYVDGQVYKINVGILKVTSIELNEDEELRSVSAGDTEAFQYDGVPGGRAVVVKPMFATASTNMTIFTTKRTYYLQLQEAGGSAHYAVRFTAPRSTSSTTNGGKLATAPKIINSNYGGNRLTEITPDMVYDDGTFTYFSFKENAPVPAIFRVTGGRELTVNSTPGADGVIRVSGISKYWVLRAGSTETVIAKLGGE